MKLLQTRRPRSKISREKRRPEGRRMVLSGSQNYSAESAVGREGLKRARKILTGY